MIIILHGVDVVKLCWLRRRTTRMRSNLLLVGYLSPVCFFKYNLFEFILSDRDARLPGCGTVTCVGKEVINKFSYKLRF